MGTTPSSLPLNRQYLTWKEAIQLRVDGELEKLEQEVALEVGNSDAATRCREGLNAFLANADTLSRAPMEPPKDSAGHYDSFGLVTSYCDLNVAPAYAKGADIKGSHGRETFGRVTLVGTNLNLGDLQRHLRTAKELLSRGGVPFPDFSSLEKTLGFTIEESKAKGA